MEIKFSHVQIEKQDTRKLLFCVFKFEIEEETIFFNLGEFGDCIKFNFLENINYLSHLLLELQINKEWIKKEIKCQLKEKRKQLKEDTN